MPHTNEKKEIGTGEYETEVNFEMVYKTLFAWLMKRKIIIKELKVFVNE